MVGIGGFRSWVWGLDRLLYLEFGCISYCFEIGWEVYVFYREYFEVLVCKVFFLGLVYGDYCVMCDLFCFGLICVISVKNNIWFVSEVDEFDVWGLELCMCFWIVFILMEWGCVWMLYFSFVLC